MSDNTGFVTTDKSGSKAGMYIGIIAIILSVIGFFWQPAVMGICGIVLGLFGVLKTPYRNLCMPAVILGVISLLIGLMP